MSWYEGSLKHEAGICRKFSRERFLPIRSKARYSAPDPFDAWKVKATIHLPVRCSTRQNIRASVKAFTGYWVRSEVRAA
jgi:hypothetical protein